MAIWHAQRKKKISGSVYKKKRDKRKFEMGRAPALTKVDEETAVSSVHIRGKQYKQKALRLNYANILDPQTKKVVKAKLKKVIENNASRHFARMGIITKGAIIETDKGKAKITNRPSQEGMINAVLIK